MDHAAHKILESATYRALHAQGFSRSSSQASLVLTDLLSRYLSLLSSTCAKYAQHAGRTTLSPRDALNALDELGVSSDELKEYCASEGLEMGRYSIRSVYLNEFKTQLADGLRQDTDDAIPLVYAPLDSPLPSEDEEESDQEEQDAVMDVDAPSFSLPDAEQNVLGPETVPLTRKDEPPIPRVASPPPLPLSPISNPSSPARKRLRTASWKPPSHVPDFLPPFPTVEEPVSRQHSPRIPPLQLPPTSLEAPKIDKPPSPPPQSQSVASLDYLAQVPYVESTLASQPEWHLPQPPPPFSSMAAAARLARLPTPQTEPSLIKAYHHILTHPPPSHHTANPARHKVALALLSQTQDEPRWDPPDSLYSTVAPCPPRVSTIAPTHPLPVAKKALPGGDSKVKDKDSEPKLPVTQPRPISSIERLSYLVSQQPSRIPGLARSVLPPSIHTRTTRLTHPPVLMRGTQKLVYGIGIPAPWNSAPLGSSTAKEGNAHVNGKDSNSTLKPTIPDARLFATWEAETKSYKTPLPAPLRNRSRMGSIQSNAGVTLSLNRGRTSKGA
ncbi:hypothetical protein HGRIS_006600 [Hohenbuehelia grisea]|uniref:Bromodomain associated domain-containing protein n=1 Tax=Hohenbuehelia grisea TaxID=104357 RepID=A0ABR3JAZ7_9AGAR